MTDDIVVTAVVAAARNGAIGRNGDLPWRIPSDLKWFKRVTLGKPVVMGRKTWVSIGRPLPGRLNLIVTRDPAFSAEGAKVFTSLAEATNRAVEAALEAGASEIAIIGGSEIYAAALPRIDRIYLTEVDAEPEGDAFFPRLAPEDWVRRGADEPPPPDPRDDHERRFFVLDRRR